MKTKHLSLKEWAESDRPREKMEKSGACSLSNAELLAILLRSGSRDESALDLAKTILNSVNNNLNDLAKIDIFSMSKTFNGIGRAKAASIIAAMELSRRRMSSGIKEKKCIKSSRDIYDLMREYMTDLKYEESWVVYMNNQHRVLDVRKISQGGLNETTIDVRLIFKYAFDKLSSAIILCHNHPSGNPSPSMADNVVTKKIKDACRFVDLQFTDHVIFSEASYYSYVDEGGL